MMLAGKCKTLKVYISEDSQYKGHNLYHALVLKLREIRMAGVTVAMVFIRIQKRQWNRGGAVRLHF